MGKSKTQGSNSRIELERIRIKGVQRVIDGARQADVARELGVTRGAISQWYSRYLEHGWEDLYRKIPSGRPIIFLPEHSKKLFEIISKRPTDWSYDTELWTVGIARDVLYEQTKWYFSKTRVLSELHALGFSFQKPQVKALEKKLKK